MKKHRFLVFGAHPDDCDILFGASAIQLCRAGHAVKFVSACNGNCGHQSMDPAALAARRYQETQNSAKIAGLAEYQVMNNNDCMLEPTLALRMEVIRIIRQFCPDVVLSHRTCDYHADHRAIGQAVQDALYLCTVPLFCPEVPVPEGMRPVFAYTYDLFQLPNPFVPDAGMLVDPVIDTKEDLLCCHESQVFEWLPYDRGERDFDVTKLDRAARKAFVREKHMIRDEREANLGREVLTEMWGEAGRTARRAEVFMLAEKRNMMGRKDFQKFFALE